MIDVVGGFLFGIEIVLVEDVVIDDVFDGVEVVGISDFDAHGSLHRTEHKVIHAIVFERGEKLGVVFVFVEEIVIFSFGIGDFDLADVGVGTHGFSHFFEYDLIGAWFEENSDIDFFAHGFGGSVENKAGKNRDHEKSQSNGHDEGSGD